MTDLAIVESRADRASVHVCDRLRDLADWDVCEDDGRPSADGGGTYYRLDGAELRSFDDLHLDLERPADAFACDPDLLVFASRHSGDTGPLLTAHSTGNVGPAEYGGADHAVAAAAPNALARLLAAFDAYVPGGYDVGLECTHHGPTDVGCPSLFAELGSDESQWDDPDGAEAVARAILDLRDVDPHRDRQLVGFGGNHYVPRFERIVRETPWAVGHVAADWALEALGSPAAHPEVLEALFEASHAEVAVIDGEWPTLAETIDDLGYRVVSETWIREVADRPLDLVERVESTLGSVDDGVRFGDRRVAAFSVRELPTDLLGTASGIDPAATWAAVAAESVAFATENGGSRIGSRAALPDPADEPYAAIVESLADVLEDRYETVEIEADAVIAETAAFDPRLAAEAGVPEGPKFGKLAEGEPVTADGETIHPDRVTVRKTDWFEI